MARLLSSGDFSTLTAIVGLTAFIGAPVAAFNMAAGRKFSTYFSLKLFGYAKKLYYYLFNRIVIFIVIISILLLLNDGVIVYLCDLLKIDQNSKIVVLIFLINLFVGIFITINSAYLQAFQSFFWLGMCGVLAVLLKLFFSVTFIALNYGLMGAMLGMISSTFLIVFLGIYLVSRTFLKTSLEKKFKLKLIHIKSYTSFLIANIALIGMTQLDVVFVNWLFEPKDASSYAAASVLGKAILYLPGGLVSVLFPIVAGRRARNESSIAIFVQTSILTLFICGSCALIYFMFGARVVEILFGSDYSGASVILRWYGIAILPFALVMIAEQFLLAQGRILFAWLFLLIAPFQYLAIILWHEDILNMVISMGVSGLILLFIGYVLMAINGDFFGKERNESI